MLRVGLILPGKRLRKHWCEKSLSLAVLSIPGWLPAKASFLPVKLPASVHAASLCNLLFWGAILGQGWLIERTESYRLWDKRAFLWPYELVGPFSSLRDKTLGNIEKTLLAKLTVLSWTVQMTLIAGALFMEHYSSEHHLDKSKRTKQYIERLVGTKFYIKDVPCRIIYNGEEKRFSLNGQKL